MEIINLRDNNLSNSHISCCFFFWCVLGPHVNTFWFSRACKPQCSTWLRYDDRIRAEKGITIYIILQTIHRCEHNDYLCCVIERIQYCLREACDVQVAQFSNPQSTACHNFDGGSDPSHNPHKVQWESQHTPCLLWPDTKVVRKSILYLFHCLSSLWIWRLKSSSCIFWEALIPMQVQWTVIFLRQGSSTSPAPRGHHCHGSDGCHHPAGATGRGRW